MSLTTTQPKISNQAKAKNSTQLKFSQAKKLYRVLWKMNKSLTPQGENIKNDEMIMGKENQLIFQEIKE